uniref:Uncharacterized protein n=1 Tax=Arundo donax TaxID=35708 RepID=A0A0A9F848_ARUDO
MSEREPREGGGDEEPPRERQHDGPVQHRRG